MDRKKIITYVLLVAAVLVWGVIIAKVVRRGVQSGKPVAENKPEVSEVKMRKDTLKLDYRDPFIGEFINMKQDKKPVQPTAMLVPKAQGRPPVPDFTFKGLIGNVSGRKAMVLKNGVLHITGPGDRIGDFRIVEISPEYMIVQSGKYMVKVDVR